MNNEFLTFDEVTTIFLKDSANNITGEVVIDTKDLERVKDFPNTWRLQQLKNKGEVRGTVRVNGVKKQTTLAKWILNFPDKSIYFVNGDSLDNRRVNLSFNKPLKGNQIVVKDNISYLHVSRRYEEDLVVIIDTKMVDLISKYTWICEWKSDINDFIVYTKIYEKKTSRKIALRNLLLGHENEKTAYFVNGNRLDFRMKNIKYYTAEMTNDCYIEEGVAFIFVKVKNEERYVVTMIDEEDLARVKSLGYTWHYFRANGEPYIVNTLVGDDGKRKRVYLHRVINECPDDKVVDHINHDTLDNRKSNLRNVTASANQQNRKGANSNSLSGIRNVNWDNTHQDWIVYCGKRYIMRTKDLNVAKLAAARIRNEMFPFSTK